MDGAIRDPRAEDVDYDRLQRIFGGVSEETINKTLAATTHMVQRSGVMDEVRTASLPKVEVYSVQ